MADYVKDNLNSYRTNLKFDICGEDKKKKWGISSFMTKTLYNFNNNKEGEPATKNEEIEVKHNYNKTGKLSPGYSFPHRYFAYIIHEGKPMVLVENRDQKIINNRVIASQRYFKPATIDWHETDEEFTHFVRGTDIPFLSITSKSDKFGKPISPSSIHPDQVFHVNSKGWIICEPIKIVGDTLKTKTTDYKILWNKDERIEDF